MRLVGACVVGLFLGLAFGGLLERFRFLNLFLKKLLLFDVVVVIIGDGVGRNGPIGLAGSGSRVVLPLLNCVQWLNKENVLTNCVVY